jgi:hypothetical protein
MKACKDCNIIKPEHDFYKSKSKGYVSLTPRCKVCHKLHMNILRSTEEQREKRSKYFQDNKVVIRDKAAVYLAKNREKVNKRNRERYANDIHYRVYTNLKNRIEYSLFVADAKGVVGCSIGELLGGNIKEVIAHLSDQLKDGMTWSNKDQWEVDHIIPVSAFDLNKPEQQFKCFHYTNLQPLWTKENRSKGYKIPNQL